MSKTEGRISDQIRRNKILEPAMLAGVALSAFLAWTALYRAATVEGASVWGVPITVFLLFLVALFMSAVLVKRTASLKTVLAVSLLLSLVFAATPLHFAFLLPAIGLAWRGANDIRDGLYFSSKLRFFSSLMNGRSFFVYALIIVITSQYYALVSRSGGEVNLPTFKVSRNVAFKIGELYGRINPKYSFFSSARGMTVDKFILQNRGAGLPGEGAETGKLLERERKQLSALTGRPLDGSEPVAELFVDLVTGKINEYFSAGLAQSGESSSLPLFLSCVLFLTLLPLAAIIGYAGIFLSLLICGFLMKKGVIRKKLTHIQAESLEIL